MINKEFSHH